MLKIDQKKAIIIGSVALLLVLGLLSFFIFSRMGKSNNGATPANTKKKISQPVNIIEIADRPYVSLQPLSDGHNVTIYVNEVKKPATSVEYELEYQSGSLLQGAFGKVVTTSLPASAKILLGSCSAGGACTFHEDVQGGTVLLKFDGDAPYALKQEWRYIKMSKGEDSIASRDAKLQISGAGLTKVGYFIVYATPGFPNGLKGTPASEIYTIGSSDKVSGNVKVNLRANEEGTLKLMGYLAGKWQELKATQDGKTLSYDGPIMDVFVAVK